MDTVDTNDIEMEDVTKEKLVSDLKTVAKDAEELIRATASDMGEKTKDARARLNTALERARETCRTMQEKAVAGAKVTDKVIREHPYQSMGVAFGLGIVIGVLANRK